MGYTDSVTMPITCSGAQNSGTGYVATYGYTVTSFFNNTLTGIPVNESFGTRTNVYEGNTWFSPSPTSYTTDSSGRYGDELWVCSYGNVTPATSGPGSGSTLVYTLQQTWRGGNLATGSGLIIQTDLMNYYTDHANLTAVTSPAR